MNTTAALVNALHDAQEDFEWYPTTRTMIDVICRDIKAKFDRCNSFLDIGAGDGRVLMQLKAMFEDVKLYAIEKSLVLLQHQSDAIIPVGTEFYEQNLMGLSVDVVFCNPPYSEYEEWAYRIISTAHANTIYLILPQRWENSTMIQSAIKAREGEATILHRGDFFDAERRARAVVHIIRISFGERYYNRYNYRPNQDPFDVWFDQNIDTFNKEETLSDYASEQQQLARIHSLNDIPSMVAAFDEEYARMEENYKTIFKLDGALFKELGVDKSSVREGLKKRIQGLKNVYWQGLFDRLDVITSRLTTKTKKLFLARLTGQTAIAFTAQNAYAVVLWAIKAANQYFNAQTVEVFQKMSMHDGVSRYKSNQKTWEQDRWKYHKRLDPEKHSHYALDYRIVLNHYAAIFKGGFGNYDYPGDLHTSCHEVIDDLIAVFTNLGFPVANKVPSRVRKWTANSWEDFTMSDGRVVFQVKAFMNGNMHFRFDQQAIKALNIEAGRLLGWLRSPEEAANELGYTVDEAKQFFNSTQRLSTSSVRLLSAADK